MEFALITNRGQYVAPLTKDGKPVFFPSRLVAEEWLTERENVSFTVVEKKGNTFTQGTVSR
jgi:hypothetical protein